MREIAGLTSVRGLAAWWVVLFHFRAWLPAEWPGPVLAFLRHGYCGVDLFFVLSGYVIALNYAERLATADRETWCRFLWNRLARIYPLHVFMLMALAAAALADLLFAPHGIPPDRYDAGYFVLSLALVQNWGFRHIVEWNLVAWSISVEWLAYNLFPAVLWLARRPLRSRPACWVMAFASLALLSDLEPFRGVVEFWAGVCLFHARKGGGVTLTKAGLASSAVLAMALFGVRIFLQDTDSGFVPAGFLLLVWALSFREGVLARIMSGRLIMYLGVTSYSTYMVHVVIRDWATALLGPGAVPGYVLPACLVLTAVLSYPLYRYIELPGRRAMRRIDPVRLWRRITRPQTTLGAES